MSAKKEDLTFKDQDDYNRQPIAENLIKLLTSEIKLSPIVIDGGWGTGKTEFCYKTINLLRETHQDYDYDYEPIYVDAFKSDHADEPLMTLLAAVLNVLPKQDQKSLTQKALPTIRFGLKTSLKAGVGFLLRQDADKIADEYADVLKSASDEAINGAIESLLADHVDANKNIDTLKSALVEHAKMKKIVIFVDELDRCRPNFAVAMLESIKHIFDVEGVQFVLVTNFNQLKESIKHCYGGVDAQQYLDKFVGFSFSLPMIIGKAEDKLSSVKHLLISIKKSKVFPDSFLDINNTEYNFMKKLVTVNSLSLRQVETLVRYFEIYQVVTENNCLNRDNSHGILLLTIFGVFLFCFKPEMLKAVLNDSQEKSELEKILGLNGLVLPGERKDACDVVLAMLVLPVPLFSNSSDHGNRLASWQNAWDPVLASYFNHAHVGSDNPYKMRCSILKDVIRTLQLVK